MHETSPLCPSRREARRQSRREAILDVAAQSFLEHGYAGTTMSAIAATLGGSKGTLWSYFASKEVLFAAVIDRREGMAEGARSHLSIHLDGLLRRSDFGATGWSDMVGDEVRLHIVARIDLEP